jgi:hypothetical protein
MGPKGGSVRVTGVSSVAFGFNFEYTQKKGNKTEATKNICSLKEKKISASD